MVALLIGSLILGMSAPLITKQLKHNSFTDCPVDTEFPVSGTFYIDTVGGKKGLGSADWDNATLHFDSSRVVPTAVENRPCAVALLGCVKN